MYTSVTSHTSDHTPQVTDSNKPKIIQQNSTNNHNNTYAQPPRQPQPELDLIAAIENSGLKNGNIKELTDLSDLNNSEKMMSTRKSTTSNFSHNGNSILKMCF